RDAERAIAGATRMGQEIHVLGASTALALLDLSSGQLASAQARYAQIGGVIAASGSGGSRTRSRRVSEPATSTKPRGERGTSARTASGLGCRDSSLWRRVAAG